MLDRSSVIYQIYPRSFRDSNGDGIGDLDGITERLDHVARLGCDGVWLSPCFASPNADMGYDVSDYRTISPEYGDAAAADRLVERAHELGLGVLFDLVPSHTSIEHPWFRDRPDWYIIRDTPDRPNNWMSVCGGSVWDRDPHGRGWYCHTFYEEQPNLDWRNPEVVGAMLDVMRFWLDRGVDGFRIDAIYALFVDEKLRDNPPCVTPPRLFNEHPDWATFSNEYNTHLPEVFDVLALMRRTFPEAYFVAEAGGTHDLMRRYTRHVDSTFCFDLLTADTDPHEIATVVREASTIPGIAWMVANHDFPRLASRWGEDAAAAIAVLQLTLPGSAYIYQGDEIGMLDGPGVSPPIDRIGRDRHRHPMQWTPAGGFTTATPWLPLIDPLVRNVADQENDPASMLHLYRRLLRIRRDLSGPLHDVRVDGDVVSFRRDAHRVLVNLGPGHTSSVAFDDVVLSTRPLGERPGLPPHTGVVCRR